MEIPMIRMLRPRSGRNRQVISNLRQPVSVSRIYWYDRGIAVEVNISCRFTKCGVLAQYATDCHSPAIRQQQAVEPVQTRKRVLLVIESSRAYGRGCLLGIASYVRAHMNWQL